MLCASYPLSDIALAPAPAGTATRPATTEPDQRKSPIVIDFVALIWFKSNRALRVVVAIMLLGAAAIWAVELDAHEGIHGPGRARLPGAK